MIEGREWMLLQWENWWHKKCLQQHPSARSLLDCDLAKVPAFFLNGGGEDFHMFVVVAANFYSPWPHGVSLYRDRYCLIDFFKTNLFVGFGVDNCYEHDIYSSIILYNFSTLFTSVVYFDLDVLHVFYYFYCVRFLSMVGFLRLRCWFGFLYLRWLTELGDFWDSLTCGASLNIIRPQKWPKSRHKIDKLLKYQNLKIKILTANINKNISLILFRFLEWDYTKE